MKYWESLPSHSTGFASGTSSRDSKAGWGVVWLAAGSIECSEIVAGLVFGEQWGLYGQSRAASPAYAADNLSGSTFYSAINMPSQTNTFSPDLAIILDLRLIKCFVNAELLAGLLRLNRSRLIWSSSLAFLHSFLNCISIAGQIRNDFFHPVCLY